MEMLASNTPKRLIIPIKISFRILFIYLGYQSASWLTVILILGVHICLLGWITRAPFGLIKTEITKLSEFGLSDEQNTPQIRRRIIWPRVKKASLVLSLGIVNALICYFIGSQFTPA